ncbi:hypothetical protein ACQP1G_37065 [Nocardia sp. CA-107356]|uniref:hypothetical protein n=1 Tax=Nocardia sp. CA-107356 TaxID=3239972 RepID=UPI003D8EA244
MTINNPEQQRLTVSDLPAPDLMNLGEASAAYANLLQVAKRVLVEVSRRHCDIAPGLQEHVEDEVLVVAAGTKRKLLGSFQCGSWQHDGRPIDEIFLNADWRCGGDDLDFIEELLDTLIHELTHCWCRLSGIKDTSNRGRYHNKRFAQISMALGCAIVKDSRYGHATVGLQQWAREEYADLLRELGGALIIGRAPQPKIKTTTAASAEAVLLMVESPEPDAKYIFPACRCRTPRGGLVALRIARGSWRPGTIWCSVCGHAFEAESES